MATDGRSMARPGPHLRQPRTLPGFFVSEKSLHSLVTSSLQARAADSRSGSRPRHTHSRSAHGAAAAGETGGQPSRAAVRTQGDVLVDVAGPVNLEARQLLHALLRHLAACTRTEGGSCQAGAPPLLHAAAGRSPAPGRSPTTLPCFWARIRFVRQAAIRPSPEPTSLQLALMSPEQEPVCFCFCVWGGQGAAAAAAGR